MEQFSITISGYNDFCNGYKLFKGVASNMRFPQTIKIIRFSLAVVSFKRINFYFPWNHQKTVGFLMILGAIEVN